MTTIERTQANGLAQFFRSFIDDPLAVGAVAPSGRSLARLMTRDIAPGARVVELGPGTGTFTRAMLLRGINEGDLWLLERCRGFVGLLEREFPRANVLELDATDDDAGRCIPPRSVDFVISGLPLVLFSTAQKRRLLDNCFEFLSTSGAFYQFTYGVRCPISQRILRARGLISTLVGVAAVNVPPAFVYRIEAVNT